MKRDHAARLFVACFASASTFAGARAVSWLTIAVTD
jgi:hypothetical protein